MARASAHFTVDGIGGKRAVKEIKRQLDTLHGVSSVSVNAQANKITVDYDTTGTGQNHIRDKLEKLGYSIHDARF